MPGSPVLDMAGTEVPTRTTRLGLLGAFSLSDKSGPVELPGTVQRVVALLALHGRPLHRLKVAGTLWPDSPEERGFASLRSALWRLRASRCPVVEPSGAHLRLAVGVDADAPALILVAHRLEAGEAVEGLERLVTLFDDDLLPDWYEDWVIVWRERWRHVRLHALETLAGRLSQAGSHGLAAEAALASIRAEPLRESAHRSLIAVHLAEGNVDEAVRQYQRYRRLSLDELHVAPSPLIEELVARVVGGRGVDGGVTAG